MSNQAVTQVSPVPVARPVIGESELLAIRRPLLSGWLTQGPEVAAFEREFADHVGAPHACAVSNCTTALHLALRVLGITDGDEVITVSHSFIASANAIRYCGAVPIFVDVHPDTYNLDPARIEAVITDRTRAILAVHQLGMPCDMQGILAIARKHGLPVVEDAACAAGSEILWQGRWEPIGRPHGDIACFSFHPRKVMTTGDGGMLTTSVPEWDRQFRLWRQHSMSVPDTARHGAREVVFEQYTELGFNYRMTDIQAAVGREQLIRLPAMVAERRQIAEHYDEVLAGIEGLRLPAEPAWARTNWQSYCVRLPEACDQRQVMQSMLDAGIATRRGVMCAHREPAYRTEPWRSESGDSRQFAAGGACPSLAVSESITAHGLILPLYVGMTRDEQARVVGALAAALDNQVARAGR
ncbi:MAG: DegT/DnrJ/EryC1/StrS family aminotransferase [Vicinamibacterales bacterium]